MKNFILKISLAGIFLIGVSTVSADTKNGVTEGAQASAKLESLPPIGAVLWDSGEIQDHIFGSENLDYDTSDLPFTQSSELEFKYGMWEGTDCELTVELNGVELGTVLADDGYLSPGPQYSSWNTTFTLAAGVNNIEVITDDACDTEAIVGAFVIRGIPGQPEPESVPSLSAIGLGVMILLMGIMVMRVRRRSLVN